MTQALINNLENLNDMKEAFMQTQNKASSKEVICMDKTNSFEKVIDKKINALENKKEISSEVKITKYKNKTLETPKTLQDLKIQQNKSDNKVANLFSECKELIESATEEANVENSLDLTLTRSINELISDFKENSDYSNDEEVISIETQNIEENFSETEEETVNLNLEISTENLIIEEQSIINTIVAQNVGLVDNSKQEDVEINFSTKEETITIDFSNNDIINQEEIVNNINIISNKEVNNTKSETNIKDIVEEEILEELNIEKIEVESESFEGNNDDTLTNYQSAEEYSIKTMLAVNDVDFELNVEKVLDSSKVASMQSKPTEITSSKIIEQITKQMETLTNNSKVNIVLNPESLGKVTIQLIKTGEGLAAQFTVNSQEVKDVLMKGLDGLKESLASHGVGVDSVSVKINDTQKSEYNADWTEQDGSRGGNKQQDKSHKEEKEKGLFEKMMAQKDKNENGNV